MIAIFCCFLYLLFGMAFGGGLIPLQNFNAESVEPTYHFAAFQHTPNIRGPPVYGSDFVPPPPPNHLPRKFWPKHEETEKLEVNEKPNVEGNGVTESKIPRLTYVKVINGCSDVKIMPGIHSDDRRYGELSGTIPNLGSGQAMMVSVPSDTKSFSIWPRVNCQDNGTGCQSGGCPGKGNDHMHCQGTMPGKAQTPYAYAKFELRIGNPVVDRYSISGQRAKRSTVLITPPNASCDRLDFHGDQISATCKPDDNAEETYQLLFCPPN